ncbi:NAD-dependent DNA ligase LigA [Blattabacterium cuenoti]|uniref:NAD-dependent DNA ligase LigA n=1 Tax=Blattabacterium cuenoti TaxID=1653831 RepID=UPI00163C4923|nr:NAD-dependent DNA ligase LigA [Blattabacterium cuenoti]
MNNKIIIENKIKKLRKELDDHNYKYYVLNNPDISDYVFDKKLSELSVLEKKYPELYDPNSPSIKIGTDVDKIDCTIHHHKYKMYSLKNVYSKKELIVWLEKINNLFNDNNISFVCEPKYDGVSINLIYKNGILTHAVTRGDGEKGEDVTKNVRTITSIPLKLIGNNYPSYLEIRGEIFLPIKNFLILNKRRIKIGKNPYNNPRNTASSTLKIHNYKEVFTRGLYCVAFSVSGENLPFYDQYKSLKYINNWGFITPLKHLCKNVNDIFYFINFWKIYKKEQPYQTDGIVIKVNEYEKQYFLGCTSKYPRWAIAYKFREKPSETKLLNLTFQVGRTGIITPVANVIPISISGTTIKRVTLYNNHFIKKNEIYHGDTILLEKGGDIIPKITEINIKKRSHKADPILFLKKCPSCNGTLIKKNELYYCINKNCYSKRIKKIIHFVSDKSMNIQNIGHKIIEKLYKKGFLYNLYDLFQLKKKELLQIEGIKEKLAEKILNNIETSKKLTPYHKVIYALGIHHVGEYISKRLIEHFTNIHDLMHASYDNLISIPGIGKETSKNIITYFSIQENKHMIQMLVKFGLNLSTSKNRKIKKNSCFEGKAFVFTGKLSCMNRNRAKDIIESLGGVVYNTVNNKINFIIVGKNFGSKLEKSIYKRTIKILTEDIFLHMIKNP